MLVITIDYFISLISAVFPLLIISHCCVVIYKFERLLLAALDTFALLFPTEVRVFSRLLTSLSVT